MSGDVSLSKLIEVLKRDWSVINPARMQDILDRLVITTEDVRPHSLFSEKRYARNLVYKDREFEIMIMCWNSGQRSSIHDHAGSLGGLKILQGELTECLFARAANGMIKSLSSADYAIENTRVEETSLIHQISNLQSENGKAVSVHIYVPPLVRMNVYSLEDAAVRNILPQYFSLGSGI
ncbi:MAG TPA: cysteine dioxygenase family protein [Candidatus Acidoferrales bacterium]|nr:cysteine dioxygenase family protein [Candidatus Acidoferrales bacterium]